MIFTAIFSIIVSIFSFLFSALPTVSQLPWGTDTFLLSSFSVVRGISTVFPPLSTGLFILLYFVLYKSGLILFRLVLGHRAPKV